MANVWFEVGLALLSSDNRIDVDDARLSIARYWFVRQVVFFV